MRKIIIFIFSLSVLFGISKSVIAVDNSSYILLDVDSGRVMYGKNIDKRFLTASIAKIMTAIVAIENGNLFESYEVSNSSTLAIGSRIYLEENDVITLFDLIVGLMLRSGNDAATLISEVVFNNVDLFVDEMNNTAKRIGMGNSTFENPTGLNDDTFNYSTAYDMAILMKYAMENYVFYEISTLKKYQCTTLNNSYYWSNKHKLVENNGYVISGKTGYTKLCGRTLVSYAVIDDKKMIAVTFNEANDYNLHQTLFETANQEFEYKKIFNEGVYHQKLNKLNYYPMIKEDVWLLVKKNSVISGKFFLLLKPENSCGYLEIYEDNKPIYRVLVYPFWPKQ